MHHALALADEAAEQGEVPVGAVLVREDGLIGRGFNQPVSAHDPSAHAEIVALRDAAGQQGNYRLPGTTLYVTIEPCTMCVGAMVHARVECLVFGAREPRYGAVVSSRRLLGQGTFNHDLRWREGVLAETCGNRLKEFFSQRR